jgi:transcription factor SPT20
LIVELLDYRPVKGREAPLETPEISRVLLQPTGESFAADLARLAWNAEMRSDVEVLELEAKMLVR